MFVTIWMCTHEWSLISIRATAFTFETCHQPFSCLSALTRSTSWRSLRLPGTGTLIRIRSIASVGVSRASCSASSDAGWSIRSAVSLSRATPRVCLCKSPGMEPHPVHLVVEDDLRRNRVTVFFRILLAIPHFIWITLWTIGAFFAAVANWVATLIIGRPPAGLHRFLSSYVRYTVHLNAYLHLVANPYPGFLGEEGDYEVDVRLPSEPVAQARWTTFFRLILAIPALLISVFLGGASGPSFNVFVFGGGGRRGPSRTGTGGGFGGALTAVCAFFGWFASLVLGRMPRGLRDAGAYGIGYGAQVLAYILLLTDRYPNRDPTAMLDSVERPPAHPVHLVGEAHDLRRSRLTVFFRLPLLIPHLVWLYLL